MRYFEFDSPELVACLEDWKRASAEVGVLALLPEAEKDQLPRLQQACAERAIPLVGGIFPALLDKNGFLTRGVWLLHFDRMPPFALLPDLNGGDDPPEDRISAVFEPILEGLDNLGDRAKPTLYMFFDGLLPNIASVLEGVYGRLSDRVNYAGVNAGSETFQPMPCLFDGQRVIDQGALVLLLYGGQNTLLAHGFKVPGRTMVATSTQGNRIAMIDWQPAFEAYQALIRSEYGIELNAQNFYQYAVHYPFGILRANQEVIVRIPVALTEDGALFCVGEVPENAMLVILKSPEANADGCIDQLAADLLVQHPGLEDGSLLGFYCAGRRMHLGPASVDELAVLQAGTHAGTLGGALSLGEIGSTTLGGYPMFHNATLVCTPRVEA
jgi:hypothetical protein